MLTAPIALALLGCTPAEPIETERPPLQIAPRSGDVNGAFDESKLHPADPWDYDYYGDSLASAGDVNGDGYPDLIVSAYCDDEDEKNSGSVYFYPGGAGGLDASKEIKITASDAVEEAALGYYLDAGGDLDGDGYDDIILGASTVFGNGENGAAYVYYGSTDGPDLSSEQKITASDGDADDRFGGGVAIAGDVNGDGYDDIIVGAYYDDDMGHSSGSVYFYEGSASGVDTSTELKLTDSDGVAYDFFGQFLSDVGDVNGDGYDDIAIFSANSTTYIYYGSADGPDEDSRTELAGWEPLFAPAIGDFDGDGYDDLLRSDAIYLGGADGLDGTTLDFDSTIGNPHAIGDMDGDGYIDVLSGNDSDEAGTSSGSVSLYYGDADGPDADTEYLILASDAARLDYFGNVVAAIDMDGDGLSEIFVGADGDDDNGSMSGSVYVYQVGVDADGDGVWESDDCDDSDASAGAAETMYADADGDGYGDPDGAEALCKETSGYVSDATDCDDDDASVNSSADEVCDGIDNDCDGEADVRAIDASRWRADDDGDGYGDPDDELVSCDQPSGYVTDDGDEDCDDANPSVWPDALDDCGDGVDSDCDGYGGPEDDEDDDGLSWTEEQALGTDACSPDTDNDGIPDAEDADPTVFDASDSGHLGDTAAPGRDDVGDTGGETALEGEDVKTCASVSGVAGGWIWMSLLAIGSRRRRWRSAIS